MRTEPNSEPVLSLSTLLALLIATGAGALAGILVVPAWLPGMINSLTSNTQHAFWYLSRSSALVAYALLWLSMALGVVISNRLARLWPGGPVAFDVHQYASLLGLATACFHALLLLGDRYIQYNLPQIAIPFASIAYRPIEVGLGQLALYGLFVVTFTFYIRRWIGQKVWWLIHLLSYGLFLLALAHGVLSGTDTASGGVALFYWVTTAGLLFLTIYRGLTSVIRLPKNVAV